MCLLTDALWTRPGNICENALWTVKYSIYLHEVQELEGLLGELVKFTLQIIDEAVEVHRGKVTR